MENENAHGRSERHPKDFSAPASPLSIVLLALLFMAVVGAGIIATSI